VRGISTNRRRIKKPVV